MSPCKRAWVGGTYRDVSEGLGLGGTKEGNPEWVPESGLFQVNRSSLGGPGMLGGTAWKGE